MAADFPYDCFGIAREQFPVDEPDVLQRIHATGRRLSVPARTILMEILEGNVW